MLKIDRDNQVLEPILTQTLMEAGLRERSDLQYLIERNSKAFFDEIELKNAVLLGSEVRPAPEMVDDRIDLLALDEDGTVIVIELKRGSDKLHLLQGISYAAMIANWQPEQFYQISKESEIELASSLDDGKKINSQQRIVLVADAFEYEVLTTAAWLFEEYGVDILCIRLEVARDPGSGSEFLICEQVYPAPALEDQVIRRKGANRGESPEPRTTNEILENIANPDVSAFLSDQITKVHFDEKKKALKYVVGSRIEWLVLFRRRFASVWQYRPVLGGLGVLEAEALKARNRSRER